MMYAVVSSYNIVASSLAAGRVRHLELSVNAGGGVPVFGGAVRSIAILLLFPEPPLVLPLCE